MSKSPNTIQIEVSKQKLANAFKHLESIIEKKINTKSIKNSSEDILKLNDKLQLMEKERDEFADKYNNSKQVSKEVIKDLDISINFIEKLLEDENADS